MMYTVLIVLAVIVCAASLFMSISIMRKQQHHEQDQIHPTVARHPLLANPIVILYLAIPVLIVLGALAWWYFEIKGLT
ncbi:hypothetical protein RJP21_17290 [Paenibacillus sp. VCA1]|uniref:hypothetical protein n=1 Tax=Paenibacillus sp. VCA1 TaxID=3039148 RepID=UPI0028712B1E|nr:hypothetical protein [Paenibacillus sp. VCA1]MDR9855375.1 hypothetical protein [Paenibacillus sp. VCA1]